MKLLAHKRRSDGIALIIVMVVVLVLGVLAGGFAYMMKVEMKLAQQSSLDSDFEWLGRSGVEKAKLLLSEAGKNQANNAVVSLKQRWAGGPGDGVDTNAVAETSLEAEELAEGQGTFSIKIIDAERKFNINKVQGNMQMVLQNAMTLIGVDAGESPTIVDSILDWIDRDGDEHLAGAENDYYTRLDPPYEAKNGPIDDMTELLLIKGIDQDPEVYWGSNSTNYTPSSYGVKDASRYLNEQVKKEYRVGLIDLFTTVSLGTVNINTASADVLQLIPGIDANVAQAIIQSRAGQDGADGTEDDAPFQNINELNGRNIPGLPTGGQVNQMLGQYCRTVSRVFEVQVTCEIAGIKREYIALLDRMGPQVKTLWMYWKGSSKEQNVGPQLNDTIEQ